jgi:hypothetical protein
MGGTPAPAAARGCCTCHAQDCRCDPIHVIDGQTRSATTCLTLRNIVRARWRASDSLQSRGDRGERERTGGVWEAQIGFRWPLPTGCPPAAPIAPPVKVCSTGGHRGAVEIASARNCPGQALLGLIRYFSPVARLP